MVEARSEVGPKPADHWWTNLWRNLRRISNDEQENVRLTLAVAGQSWSVVSDDEGYFRLAATLQDASRSGWQRVSARAGDAVGTGALLLVPAQNTLGIISDIDDTILVSAVADKSELLKNTLLKNALQRDAVPGAARWYARLAARNPQPAAAPIFYLSASPRQLYRNIETFLAHAGFPRGVLITKRVTDDATSEPLLDQRAYKTAHIETLLHRLPRVRFVLVGDDGEQDPETYHDIQSRYPQRIEAVYIRHVNRDPKRARFAEQRDLAGALAAAGD